jgi:carboxyl-terminal processing protease
LLLDRNFFFRGAKMKKTILWLMLTCAGLAHAVSNVEPPQLKPSAEQAKAAAMTANYLTRYHYRALPLDDAMSLKIFDKFFKSLDGEKMLFTQADVDQFSQYNTTLDEAIKNGELNAPFLIANTYVQRVAQRFAYAREVLKKPFDFTENEFYTYNREKAPWAKNDDEVRDLWRKKVKYDWLRLKLAGKDDKAIRATLDKRYETNVTRYKLNSEDVFQLFLNAYATAIDPHTNYFGPRAADNFNIQMRLSLIGIGAVLQQKDEYTLIRELVPGGPAATSGKLKVGDRIVGVGQGEKGAVTEVLGWRLDDVVALIRGAKDSQVRLDVLPADVAVDGQHKQLTLVRKKITMEEQSAKKSIITAPEGDGERRIGVISLPGFYQDFEAASRGEKNYKSATRDVAKLLAELKKEKVDAVLIDLRNNGGGSLVEAVELTGLFIDKGPVVQQRNAQGQVRVENDTKPGTDWDGPLGVLINRGSASASEIFAAAIQDYGRGVVIGEPSFGKGTVQQLLNLDYVEHNAKPQLGELKMTMAQFFRINGGTTQLKGVVPDVSLPQVSDTESFGESSYDNALPWTSIKPAEYAPVANLHDNFGTLQVKHQTRIGKDKEFQYLQEDVAEYRKLAKEDSISLNEAVRRKENEAREARQKARQKTDEASGKKNVAAIKGKKPQANRALQKDDGLLAEERNLEAELAAEKEAKNAKDILLTEAARIMGDEVELEKRGVTRLADQPAGAVSKDGNKNRVR